MTATIKIITHLTEKQVIVTDTFGNVVNESYSNINISAPYGSYIVYMSNPIEITSFTTLVNTLDNVLVQFVAASFGIIIAVIYFIFLITIKNKGFKGVK